MLSCQQIFPSSHDTCSLFWCLDNIFLLHFVNFVLKLDAVHYPGFGNENVRYIHLSIQYRDGFILPIPNIWLVLIVYLSCLSSVLLFVLYTLILIKKCLTQFQINYARCFTLLLEPPVAYFHQRHIQLKIFTLSNFKMNRAI